MLININNKPIKVEEKPESTFSPVYLAVSTTGYLFILYLLDYVCYTFFYYHPLPWIMWVGKLLSFL